ncbi:pancreatic triacylglycerol lipase isoform X3 [Dermacentor silvarum]|uniref:pancreatic triacylglycerol lipase isoform X3 n=1 Tax=Dermacentor silvarum TaxID=543639 RepID=UPI00189B7E40|nr:pancreatic triacylglycerol lipase isoform X3 [Dermacentor silvarum]
MLSTTAFLLLLLHCKSYASTVGQAGTPDEKEMPSKAKSTDAEGRRATKEEICYANVGCFSRHDRLTLPSNFPSNPNFFMPLFHLYSRNKRHFPTVFKLRPKGSYRHLVEFRKEKPLFILVHGWLESAYAPWAQSIKDALLVEEDSNVLVVDWSGLAATTYASAAANTAAVGRTLALVVQRLMEEFPLRAALVHAIGYSFGAQVAGFFGRNIKRNTGTLIARITAALCDHIRAPLLFLESLVNKACRMVSRPCRAGFAAFLRGKCVPTDAGGDRGEMGFFSPRAAGRGVQLVSTGAGPLGYFCNKERKE